MNGTETDLLRQILIEVQSISLGGGVADGSITTAKLADNAVTTAKILDGSVTPAKLSQPPVVVTKAGDESRSSTATSNDAELLFNAVANSWYDVEFYLTVTATPTLAGMRVLLNLPSGGEAVITGRSNANTTISNINNSNVISSLIAPANILASQTVYIFAKVRITTAGVVALSWAQNTTDAGNPVTIKAGSILIAAKVG